MRRPRRKPWTAPSRSCRCCRERLSGAPTTTPGTERPICTPALNLASGLVIDNASTHQTPAIQRWLVAHPRFHVHLTPTYSSWLNLAERWFSELTTKWLRRGSHRSVAELERSIRAWVAMWNEDPGRLCGTRLRTRSWNPSPHIVSESLGQDTSEASPQTAEVRTIVIGKSQQ
jgi:DDE superfamily endonuclease